MRCFFQELIPAVGREVALDELEERHLFRILRARPGERALLVDGRGCLAEAEILPDRRLRIAARRECPPPQCFPVQQLHRVQRGLHFAGVPFVEFQRPLRIRRR